PCRHDRHHGPRVPARSRAQFLELQRGIECGAGALLDADLHADGGGSGLPAGRIIPGNEQMKRWFTLRNAIVAALLVLLVLLPVYTTQTGNTFMMTLFTRIIILAIAAVSLNLIMGFGGMVSFG